MRIDVRGSRELRDVFLAMQTMDTDVKRSLRHYAKSTITQPWVDAVKKASRTPLERHVIGGTAVASVSNQNVRIQAAGKGRKMRGGLQPKIDYPAVEFGAMRDKRTTYTRNGARVTRHTARQMRPRRPSGYVFYPTARKMIPRLASLWVQSIVKGVANVFEGRKF